MEVGQHPKLGADYVKSLLQITDHLLVLINLLKIRLKFGIAAIDILLKFLQIHVESNALGGHKLSDFELTFYSHKKCVDPRFELLREISKHQ